MPDVPGKDVPDGTPVDIVVGAQLPEMSFTASRAFCDQPTIEELRNSLKINLLVFDASGVMLQYIPPKDITIEKVEPGTVYFLVHGIMSSKQKRRLHFVVTSADDITKVEGGEYITAMASENVVMPALVVSDNTDAYWGVSEQDEITDQLELPNIQLLRNFVKVTVSIEQSDKTKNFKLLGYAVVNQPGKGTVAPYIYQKEEFADFLDASGTLKDYNTIISEGYQGVNPAGVEETMKCTSADEVTAAINASSADLGAGCYMYERSQSDISTLGNSVKVTYLIVKGEYNSEVNYYKIDLGHNVAGDFQYFDLLRNFNYAVNIIEVGGEGSKTVEDAMKSVASNNLSASVVTRDLFSISYYNEIIEVTDTRVIFTEQTTNYQIKFRYTVPPELDYKFEPANLWVYDMNKEGATHYNMDFPAAQGSQIDLSGEVISAAKARLSGPDADRWYTLSFSTNAIPADGSRKEQTLRVFYSGGTVNLGRTITLMLRQPWELTNVGIEKDNAPITKVGSTTGSEFTVKFTLPPGMVSTQFPLIMTFESDKQNIYAKKGTPLQVVTEKSGFKGGTTDNVIKYEWRINWSDYSGSDGSGSTNGRELKATFLTNTTTADDVDFYTKGVDDSTLNGNREDNNGKTIFCIRIVDKPARKSDNPDDKGLKYIKPYYVNITREAQ